LATTLLAKVAMLLFEPSRLLEALHPGLGIQIKTLVLLGATSEIVVLAVGALGGRRALLIGSFVLGTLFFAFHAYLAFSGIPSPCRCLGSLTQFSAWLSKNEAGVAVLLSLSLIAVSTFGLSNHRTNSQDNGLLLPPLFAGALWLGSGAFVILAAGTKSLGGDEGMEMSKALLLQRDHPGFLAAWNDQAPVFPWIIARVWDLTGLDVPAARWLTLAITTLLPVSISMALRAWGMSWAASILGPGMLLHPDCSLILGSCMQDLPAVALGASAVVPLVLLRTRPNTALFLSALVASFAMVFKPTAAFGCLLLLTHLRPGTWIRYGAAAVVGFFVISFASGYDIVRAAASHSYAGREAQRHAFDLFGLVMASPSFAAACFVAAAAGCFYGPRKLVLGVVGVAALSITIHLIHRPFWTYYAPHMVVPLLLLTGIGIVSVLKQRRALAFGFSAILLCFAAITSVPFLLWNIRSGTPVESRACYLIQQQGATVRRIVSEDPWAPLSIGVTPLPETMILPSKRIWIGDWNPNDAAAAIRDQAPEVVVLHSTTASYRPVQAMLRSYRHLGLYQGFEVYVLTNLPPVTLPKNDLKKLRL
jgi:hypothetical protein